MKISLAHNHFEMDHLVAVMQEMQELGAPTIRVMYITGDLYQAIEGCHRLRAAAALGITPIIEELEFGTLRKDVEGLDYEDGCCDDDEVIDGIGDWENDTLIFEDN